MNFIIYNLEGKILRTGSCPVEMFDLQPQEGELILEGEASDTLNVILNGQVACKPAKTYERSLEDAKILKGEEVRKECETFILSGFNSDALGSSHMYPSNSYDQINLSGSVLKSTLASSLSTATYAFKCQDPNGVWLFRPHTASQIQQVGSDSYDFILAARGKNSCLQNQIVWAETQEQLDAITWEP